MRNTKDLRQHTGQHRSAGRFGLCAMALAIGMAWSTSPDVQAQALPNPSIAVNIPATSLGDALTHLGRQARMQILFNPELVEGKRAPALHGTLAISEALDRLLANSGLVAMPRGGGYVIQTSSTREAQLQTITVSSAADNLSTEGSGSYTTHATTIGKLEQSLREIPQSVSILTRQRLDDQNITNITQAMAQAPGVTVTTNGAFAQTGYLIRGYGALQQQDGISVGADESYTIAPPRDMEIYDRVEVLRGPTGLLEGSGDPGGVINLVRKRPQADFGGSVSLSAGSWNNYRQSASLTGSLNEARTLRGRAIVVNQNRDFFYDKAEENRSQVYGIVEADLTPATLLTISTSYARSDSIPFYGLPPNGGGFPRSTYLGADWNKTEVPHQIETMADIVHTLDNGWKLKGALVYQDGETRSRMGLAMTPVQGSNLANFYGYRMQEDRKTIGAEISASGSFQLLGKMHQAIFGATWSRLQSDLGEAATVWSNVDLVNPDLPLSDLASTDDYRNETITTKSSIYGVTRLKLADPLTLILGGRFNNYEQKSRGTGLLNGSDWTKSNARARYEFTPYGGLVWDFHPNLSWYASYAEIFAPQTARDRNGRTLDPRVGWQVETGIKGEFFEGRLNTALSVFRIRDKNRAMTDLSAPGACDGGYCSVAGGLQQTQGWEAEVNGRLTPNWEIGASYVRNDFKVLETVAVNSWDIPVGANFSPHTPKHMLRIWNTYRLAGTGWTFGGGVAAQSALTDKTANPVQHNPGFTVYSAQVGYRFNDQWNLSLNVNNLFDRHYTAYMGYAANRWNYGEPRSVALTLRGNF